MKIASRGMLLKIDERGNETFISHAHSDHAFGSSLVYSSEPTAILMNAQRKEFPSFVKVSDASHVLGSLQFKFSLDEEIVYTGDINMRGNIFFDPPEILEAETLFIDDTYIHTDLPDPFDVYHEIERWVLANRNKNIVFGAYALGKAQELIKILNEIDIVPFVSRKIKEVSDVYKKFGIQLEYFELGKEKIKAPFVAIIEHHKLLRKKHMKNFLSIAFGRKTLFSLATGWASRFLFRGIDKVFPLSDHSGRKEILEYIELSGAKKVYNLKGKPLLIKC